MWSGLSQVRLLGAVIEQSPNCSCWNQGGIVGAMEPFRKTSWHQMSTGRLAMVEGLVPLYSIYAKLEQFELNYNVPSRWNHGRVV